MGKEEKEKARYECQLCGLTVYRPWGDYPSEYGCSSKRSPLGNHLWKMLPRI